MLRGLHGRGNFFIILALISFRRRRAPELQIFTLYLIFLVIIAVWNFFLPSVPSLHRWLIPRYLVFCWKRRKKKLIVKIRRDNFIYCTLNCFVSITHTVSPCMNNSGLSFNRLSLIYSSKFPIVPWKEKINWVHSMVFEI